jgi:quaternary ammonium compound-resistance protein SugE
MAWTFLLIASVFEVIWATALKYSDGFSKPVPSAISVVGMVLSVVFLGLSLKTLPMGTAYAVWTGIGAVLTAIAGIVLFKESAQALRIFCLLMIVGGVVGLKFSSSH